MAQLSSLVLFFVLSAFVCGPVSARLCRFTCQNGHCEWSWRRWTDTCECFPGFEGDDCETDINECASSPCKNDGTCVDRVNGFVCACHSTFNGTLCEDNLSCLKHECENGATCVPGIGKYTCQCQPGYKGRMCDVDIDECASNPCQHEGQCRNGVNSYFCECPPGYSGANCETNTNECDSNPCQNDGVCIDQVASFSCDCRPGYKGVRCETAFPQVRSSEINGGHYEITTDVPPTQVLTKLYKVDAPTACARWAGTVAGFTGALKTANITFYNAYRTTDLTILDSDPRTKLSSDWLRSAQTGCAERTPPVLVDLADAANYYGVYEKLLDIYSRQTAPSSNFPLVLPFPDDLSPAALQSMVQSLRQETRLSELPYEAAFACTSIIMRANGRVTGMRTFDYGKYAGAVYPLITVFAQGLPVAQFVTSLSSPAAPYSFLHINQGAAQDCWWGWFNARHEVAAYQTKDQQLANHAAGGWHWTSLILYTLLYAHTYDHAVFAFSHIPVVVPAWITVASSTANSGRIIHRTIGNFSEGGECNLGEKQFCVIGNDAPWKQQTDLRYGTVNAALSASGGTTTLRGMSLLFDRPAFRENNSTQYHIAVDERDCRMIVFKPLTYPIQLL